MENEKEEKIVIALAEYKELLEIKGRYEELKNHPEIKYIHIYQKPYVEKTPTITWTC